MKIKEIELLSDNLIETEKFYTEVLGFNIVQKGKERIAFNAGETILTFIKCENQKPKYHFAFNIPNNKLEEAIHWISSKIKLIPVTENSIIADFDTWFAKAIYFFDNNGNILEFITRYHLDNASGEPFTTSSILYISEIGIVTDTPQKTALNFIENDHLSYFPKGIKNEKFAILGTDEGLFIIVATDRHWYPTDIPAEKHYVKIKISLDGEIKVLTVN